MREAAPQAADGRTGWGAAATDADLRELLGDLTVGMLRETFDHWSIGETDGRLLAVRTGSFGAVGPRSLIRGHVMAETVIGLAEQLCLQAWLESLPAAELEAVWREGITADGAART